ncbi:glycosyltransferase family 2 protein [Paenibacillus dendritiformis]|uniref:glycosyltransferase family 2 protein n=1 Tax=Paenibacillus dendritiformis TaxID=130049 RepID=UPI003647960F
MIKKPLVSIVMLSWNRKEDVRQSLLQIMNQEYQPIEIILVDNCSTDGTIDMVRRLFPSVIIIEMKKNMGIAAYNFGFEAAKGEYILILDDDSFPAPNAVIYMVEKFEKDRQLGMVAFDVRNVESYDQVAKTDNVEKFPSAVIGASGYYMSFNGAGAGVRKSVFKEVGYYPGEFFLYNNEQDVAFRIWNSGYKIVFYPDCVSYHKYSPTNRTSWRAPFYYTRNAFWVIWKNYPLDLAIIGTIRMIFKSIYYSLEQRTPIYINAMITAFAGIGSLKGKRKAVKREIAQNLRFPLDTNFTFYR